MNNRRLVVLARPAADAGAAAIATHRMACPRCNSSVFRVSRRFVDLVVSLFIPVRRFRCIAMNCAWEGALRDKPRSVSRAARGDLLGQ